MVYSFGCGLDIYHSILRQYAQVCEYARTWKRNSLVIKWMMF